MVDASTESRRKVLIDLLGAIRTAELDDLKDEQAVLGAHSGWRDVLSKLVAVVESTSHSHETTVGQPETFPSEEIVPSNYNNSFEG